MILENQNKGDRAGVSVGWKKNGPIPRSTRWRKRGREGKPMISALAWARKGDVNPSGKNAKEEILFWIW